MLNIFKKNNLDKLGFDHEDQIKMVGDLWVISADDEDGVKICTLFYNANRGFRVRDEDSGKYYNSTRYLYKNTRDLQWFFLTNYKLDDVFNCDLSSDWEEFTKSGDDIISRRLSQAKRHGEFLEMAEKRQSLFDELKILEPGDQIAQEIRDCMDDRLVIDGTQIVHSPCGHEDLSPREFARMMVGDPQFVLCPRCGQKHLLYRYDSTKQQLGRWYIRWEHRGKHLYVCSYPFYHVFRDGKVDVQLDDKVEVLRISKDYSGDIKREYFVVENGKAEEANVASISGFLSSSCLMGVDQACTVLEDFGEYGNKLTLFLQYLLQHPNNQLLNQLFEAAERDDFRFLAKHDFYHLLKKPSVSGYEIQATDWMMEHPEYLSYIRKERMSFPEIYLLKIYVDNGKKLTHQVLSIYRKHASRVNFSETCFLFAWEKIIQYASLGKVLNYLSTRDYNVYDLKDYWEMLLKLPDDRMLDEKSLFPDDLKREHDIVTIELQVLDEYQDRLKRKEQSRTLLTNWVDYFDQGFVDSNDEFVLSPFDSVDQIKEEAKELRICIGADHYVTDYVDGETLLCALRKKDDPTTPFVSVEIRNGCLVQASSRFNQTPEYGALKYLRNYCSDRGIFCSF